ncbi:MAG TPA: DUF882 domain-containing protein [Methylococcaceae bacterium]|nr:DUF882 domain-containing protein [Methylococcaceae bacterium]
MFLRTLAAGAAGSLMLPAGEVFAKTFGEARQLSFLNLHTDEKFRIDCCPGKRHDVIALRRFNEFLRDHRTGEVHPMDPALLDILNAVAALTHSRGTFQVICGYRSPQTNAMLHRTSSGVVENSLHTVGRAIDVRLSDVNTKTLQKAGIALEKGGVGYYRQSDFVHLDTGRVRTW